MGNNSMASAMGSKAGNKTRQSEKVNTEMMLRLDDCDPAKSAEIFGSSAWTKATPAQRTVIMYYCFGTPEKDIAGLVGQSKEDVVAIIDRIDKHRRMSTQRDMIVARIMMFQQIEAAALQYITPKKLMMASAKDLAVISAMSADKAAKAHDQLMKYDKEHPEGREENQSPLERLRKLQVVTEEDDE